jgi:3-hydroxybutyryl-CoA dehydratase
MSYTQYHLFFDDLEVGKEWESQGRTLTQTDIVNFAGLSGDFNPIHVDLEFAKQTPFRQPIAHGLLVWSIASGLAANYPLVRTLAFLSVREWEFKGPVFVNDTIRVRSRVMGIEPRSRNRRAIITWQRQVLNQADKLVQGGVTITLVEGRAAVKDNDPAPERLEKSDTSA